MARRPSSPSAPTLAPDEAYLFKLGPVDAPDAPRSSLYVAVHLEVPPTPPVLARTDAEGLAALLPSLRGKRLSCEPRLARAGAPHGLTSRPLPKGLLKLRAMLAYSYAVGPEAMQGSEPQLWEELLEESARLWKAAPWRWWSNVETLTLSVSDEEGPREVCLLGNGGEEFGFALYAAPGTVARGTEAMEAGEEDALLRIDALSLLFTEEPAWARAAVRQGFKVPLLPLPLTLVKGVPTDATVRELVLLLATCRALVHLTPLQRAQRGEASSGDVHVEVHVRAPTPLFTGLLTDSTASPFTRGLVSPAPVPSPLPASVPKQGRPQLPHTAAVTRLAEFASPLVERLGPLPHPAGLYEVLALAMTAWNAVVLDDWEPEGGRVEAVRRAIAALPAGLREDVSEDFERLVERKRTHFAEDPRLFDGLHFIPEGPLQVGVTVEERLTPAMESVYSS